MSRTQTAGRVGRPWREVSARVYREEWSLITGGAAAACMVIFAAIEIRNWLKRRRNTQVDERSNPQ